MYSQDNRRWPIGAASRCYLEHSLRALSQSLKQIGINLVLRAGNAATELSEVCQQANAQSVYCARSFDTDGIVEELEVSRSLVKLGVELKRFNSTLLFDPEEISNKSHKPYKVFGAFYREINKHTPPSYMCCP
ncbi:MAG: deoxyribodipyrimidine photo-lyase [Deltaproteobacteria bacterium]|nr:deoxyribodipyrimidine photo-lyase [Deltaproteobacteria bacterium]